MLSFSHSFINRRVAMAASLFGVAVLASACHDSTDTATAPVVATHLLAFTGVGQTGLVGNTLSDSLAVLVTSSDGQPVAGVPVTWSVKSGGGALSASTDTTDASGHAAIAYTAGTAPGSAAVVATISGVDPLEFDATVLPGAPATMLADPSDPQSIVAGSAATTLEVHVTDSFGNPISGLSVLWNESVGDTGDALAASSSITDANGVASVQFSADSTAGARTITATTPNGVSYALNIMVAPIASLQR